MTDPDSAVVLVVEDEPDVAETYNLWLRDDYEVRVTTNGAAALAELETGDVDVTLLDRMMPEMSGDEVLEEIRTREIDCRVVMVTAVDPDFDVIEMGFDDYITKPPTREGLQEIIEALLERDAYADEVISLESLVARREALRAEKTAAELAQSEAYADLEERIERRERTLDDEAEQLADDVAFVGALRELDEGEPDADSAAGSDASAERSTPDESEGEP